MALKWSNMAFTFILHLMHFCNLILKSLVVGLIRWLKLLLSISFSSKLWIFFGQAFNLLISCCDLLFQVAELFFSKHLGSLYWIVITVTESLEYLTQFIVFMGEDLVSLSEWSCHFFKFVIFGNARLTCAISCKQFFEFIQFCCKFSILLKQKFILFS